MQRKVHQRDRDREIPFQLFNTPGTEVTPRSHIVGEDFEQHRLGHRGTPSAAEHAIAMLSPQPVAIILPWNTHAPPAVYGAIGAGRKEMGVGRR
jgi:hypothetical protein